MSVVAWIVAIEQYEARELNIEAAVGAWALDFALLLLERGVSKLVLNESLASSAANDSRLAKLPATVRRLGAAQADIQNALPLIEGADVLLLYWVGHGIMAPSRRLVCADSPSIDKPRVVDTDSLLNQLRSSSEYPRTQIGFFECCAQMVSMVPATLDLGGAGDVPTRQYFFHAASAAQVATATTEGAGFSSTIIDVFRPPAAFPPNPDALFDGLKTAFANLPLHMKPVLLQRTEGSGDVWSSGTVEIEQKILDAATLAELKLSQFKRLWQHAQAAGLSPGQLASAIQRGSVVNFVQPLLAAKPGDVPLQLLQRAADQVELQRDFERPCLRLGLTWQEWLSIHRRVCDDSFISRSNVQDLSSLFLTVLDQAEIESGLRSFIMLLELAARRARKGKPAESGYLSQRVASHPLLGPLYKSAVENLPDASEALFLLLAVHLEPNEKLASLETAWTFPANAGGFSRRKLSAEGTLAQQINGVVQQVLEEHPDRPLTVELLLPNQLLSLPKELLELVDPELDLKLWLEAEHPIMLRWRSRMQDKDGKYRRGTWTQQSSQISARVSVMPQLSCAWRPDAVTDPHIIGLTFPGPCPADPTRNSSSFFAELLKGYPYMCWPREEADDVEEFKRTAAQLFSAGSVKRLPELLKTRRADSLLTNLVVMIDEPERNPYLNPSLYEETRQRGAV